MQGDVVGLPDIQRQRRPGQRLAQQVPAQERGHPTGPGDRLQHLAQDLLLQPSEEFGGRGSLGGLRVSELSKLRVAGLSS